ncbi:transcriptional regulator GcvA [Pararhodospirillum oryzae]|uniref:LysR family transcriptional regulator n=1 Tax=Pararhodospirillum oryzae TaxID=478448 RepID=A0A512HAZ8_9PROT|nr:transcriptional regulator GcvA [Pararhodospirillum oryzae]GEO82619.1 LysR family transcriptional regulator [Pararhodospirillum oryzae]
MGLSSPSSRRRLPPLNALRAFEAVARYLSVTQAAEELFVTPAAVSQQIRQLEETLGCALVRRQGRGVALTPAGEVLLPGLSEGFDRLVLAVNTMREARSPRTMVRVAVPPSFADKWLLPRLGGFIESHPDLDVHVIAGMDLLDLHREPVDLAVRFGAGQYPGLAVELLREEEVFPVCAPGLLAGSTPLRDLSDLRNHTLIHDDNPVERGACPDWALWLTAAGRSDLVTYNGVHFNQSSMVLDAAVQGLGVALAKGFLARDDLEGGRLIRPFTENHVPRFAYWIVALPQALTRAPVRSFRDWLRQEVS